MAFGARLGALCLFLCLVGSSSGWAAGFDGKLMIGTGSPKGVYYALGRSLAKLANKYSDLPRLKFSVQSTAGSVENINGLSQGRFHFAIVQADRAYQAWEGKGPWARTGRQKKLRSILALYPEAITLAVSVDSGIKDIKTLKSKRIGVGKPGSGTRANVRDVFKSSGFKQDRLKKALDLDPQQSSALLLSGGLDGFFYTVGHPNRLFKELFKATQKAKFIAIPSCAALTSLYPYYVDCWIPLEPYPGCRNKGLEVHSCGVMAVLVTSSEVPLPWVYRFVHAMVSHFKELKKANPVLRRLRLDAQEGGHWSAAAPYHSGAKRYFDEFGIKYAE